MLDTDKYVLEPPPPKKKNFKNLLLGVFITSWSTNHLLCYPSILQNLKCWSRKPQQNLRTLRNFMKIATNYKICQQCKTQWERWSRKPQQKSVNLAKIANFWWKLQKIVKLCVNNLISGKRGVQEGSNKTCKLCENCKKIQNLSTKQKVVREVIKKSPTKSANFAKIANFPKVAKNCKICQQCKSSERGGQEGPDKIWEFCKNCKLLSTI